MLGSHPGERPWLVHLRAGEGVVEEMPPRRAPCPRAAASPCGLASRGQRRGAHWPSRVIHLRAGEGGRVDAPATSTCPTATASPCGWREPRPGAGGAPVARGRVVHLRAGEGARREPIAPSDEHLAGRQQRRRVAVARRGHAPVGLQGPVAGSYTSALETEPLAGRCPQRRAPCRSAAASPCGCRERRRPWGSRCPVAGSYTSALER